MSGSNDENERQYRIIDQLMTAHSVLRDRFRRRAEFLKLSLLILSVALNTFVFASDETFKLLFGFVPEAKLWIGVISTALLALSIIEFRVDWEGQSRSHGEALERLGRLKAIYREAHARGEGDAAHGHLGQEFAGTMEQLPPIPEQSFAQLKGLHHYKRLLSREIDEHPAVPVWLLALRLRWQAIRRLRDARANDAEGT